MTEKRKPDNRSWFKIVIIMLGLIFVLWILEYIAFITYFFLGVIHFHEGKFDLAIADFTKAIQLKSQFPEPFYNRGVAYHKNGKYDLAVIDYTKAIQLKPDLVEAYINRGVIYLNEGKFDLAIADFTKAIQIKPNVAEAYFFRGLAYKKKGEIDKAIIDFKKAKNIDNKSKIKKKIEQELNKLKEIVKH
jgi:tetratricopeptide (TPR) repeat protein